VSEKKKIKVPLFGKLPSKKQTEVSDLGRNIGLGLESKVDIIKPKKTLKNINVDIISEFCTISIAL
jgi:hypothetical protein